MSDTMKVLVLGTSGSGKSTLIKSIAGTDVKIGVGEGQTQEMTEHHSDVWDITFIDTKGFEYNLFKQLDVVHQIKKYTKKQLQDTNTVEKEPSTIEKGIDVVWYCVDGTCRRMFSDNIKLMNKAIKGWDNIPVFVAVTKSYSLPDIAENVEAIKNSFAKFPNVNLKGIIPVVAEEYRISDDISVYPKGIEELCESTRSISDEAQNTKGKNRQHMILQQKRFTAESLVTGATLSGAAIGAIPFNFADSLILVPLETGLTKALFKVYHLDFSTELITSIVGSAAITQVAKLVVEPLRAMPITGSIVNGLVAGAFVFAVGEAGVGLCEAIVAGKIDPNQIDTAVDFVSEKIKANPIFESLYDYVTNNISELRNKNIKEIKAISQEVLIANPKKKE